MQQEIGLGQKPESGWLRAEVEGQKDVIQRSNGLILVNSPAPFLVTRSFNPTEARYFLSVYHFYGIFQDLSIFQNGYRMKS